ncbi:hypothetical protein ACT3R7_11655 [Halomonas sp. AOP43-A1-21]
MTQVTEQKTHYGQSSIEILSGLEPVKERPSLFAECANPILACRDSIEVLNAVIAFEDVLLKSFRHYKVKLAVVMRRLRRYTTSVSARADMVLRAIQSLSGSTGLLCKDVLYRCRRYLMLTAQHDDAKQSCPAAGLAAM